MLGGFQADIDALPPLSRLPPPAPPPGPASGSGQQPSQGARELLAPFALRDWCHALPDRPGPAAAVAGEDWIPAGQLDRVAAKGRGPGRRVRVGTDRSRHKRIGRCMGLASVCTALSLSTSCWFPAYFCIFVDICLFCLYCDWCFSFLLELTTFPLLACLSACLIKFVTGWIVGLLARTLRFKSLSALNRLSVHLLLAPTEPICPLACLNARLLACHHAAYLYLPNVGCYLPACLTD
jgi:hypothetical protein